MLLELEREVLREAPPAASAARLGVLDDNVLVLLVVVIVRVGVIAMLLLLLLLLLFFFFFFFFGGVSYAEDAPVAMLALSEKDEALANTSRASAPKPDSCIASSVSSPACSVKRSRLMSYEGSSRCSTPGDGAQ